MILGLSALDTLLKLRYRQNFVRNIGESNIQLLFLNCAVSPRHPFLVAAGRTAFANFAKQQ